MQLDTNARLWKVADADYFADYSAVSNSMLSAFQKSPAIYHGKYVSRSVPDDVTDAMRKGSCFHKAMEFYGKADVPYIICQKCDRRTKDGKETYAIAQQIAEASSLPLVMQDEHDAIVGMVKSVTSHPIASLLIQHGKHREIAIRWHDPETGIECKCKPDLISGCLIGEPQNQRPALVDYKTALDPYPDAFGRSVANFSYHRQAAHYCAGAEALFGEPFAWCLVVVGSEPPHETFVYVIEPPDMARGERERSRLLRDMNRRIDSGDWTHPASGMVTTIAMPAWSKEKGDEL